MNPQQELIFSQAGSLSSLASRFLKQVKKEGKTTTAISGRKCFESFEKFAQLGFLAKTLLESSIWHSNKCALTWKPKVTKSNRLLFQLAPSTRRTEETGFGLLPTALASDATTGAIIGKNDKFKQTSGLPRKINQNGTDGSIGLARLMRLLPTPTANTGKNLSEGINWDMSEKKSHLDGVFMNQCGTKTGLRLQPNFVEWMMGYPIGWTELKPSEMQSSHKSHMK